MQCVTTDTLFLNNLSPEEDSESAFVGRYVAHSRHYASDAPSLRTSLKKFQELEALHTLLPGNSKNLKCLIQGYTAPHNAEAVREFLRHIGNLECDITAIDLLNLELIYARLGVPFPAMNFIQGDAGTDLEDRIGQNFDLLIQDFIMNCAPPVKSARILSEGARCLRPGGLALISFTDNLGLTDSSFFTPADLARQWNIRWDATCTSLEELAIPSEMQARAKADLMGSVVFDPASAHHTFITFPSGRFEFFMPHEAALVMMSAAGLQPVVIRSVISTDYNGIDCRRHHCILQRTKAPTPPVGHG